MTLYFNTLSDYPYGPRNTSNNAGDLAKGYRAGQAGQFPTGQFITDLKTIANFFDMDTKHAGSKFYGLSDPKPKEWELWKTCYNKKDSKPQNVYNMINLFEPKTVQW